jgi:regulator of protease activity HflC (stomatin/prohibitin superfamily)
MVFGKAEFRRTLRGPSSTGISWRLYVTNIDMRTKSYEEDFQLLTSDNLNVQFEVNTRISLRPGSSKQVVERWGAKKWYEWNVKEPLRTIVRREVTRVSAIEIQLKTNAVRQRIFERLLKKYQKSPIKIESVDIGDIRFPAAVTRAIERKIGQKQELERQQYLLAKTKKEAAIKVLEALKAAKQQRIISSTLDPLYVQRQAVQVYRLLGESPNKTVLVLPNSGKGTALPLVLESATRKVLSAEDKKLLEEMEERYTKLAKEAKVEVKGQTWKGDGPKPGAPALPEGGPPPVEEPGQPGAGRQPAKAPEGGGKKPESGGKAPRARRPARPRPEARKEPAPRPRKPRKPRKPAASP